MADIKYRDKPILNDWTTSTLVLDLTNSLGEQYHFEIEPEADAQSIPTRPTSDPTGNVILNMYMPLMFDFSKIKPLAPPVKKKPTPHSPTGKKSIPKK